MPTINISDGQTRNIDLGNSRGMNISAQGGTAQVHIDYDPAGRGIYTSAVKVTAGFGNPIFIQNGNFQIVPKSALESEHVRVGVHEANISVTY